MEHTESEQSDINKMVTHGKGVYALEKWKSALRSTKEKLAEMRTSQLWDASFIKSVEEALDKKS
jgi:hypothetical protein